MLRGLQSIVNLNAKARRSALLALLFLALQILVWSPSAHAFVHPDSKSPDHECAVTLLSHGQVESPSPAVATAAIQPIVSILAQAPAFAFVSADAPVIPGRGPPSVS